MKTKRKWSKKDTKASERMNVKNKCWEEGNRKKRTRLKFKKERNGRTNMPNENKKSERKHLRKETRKQTDEK